MPLPTSPTCQFALLVQADVEPSQLEPLRALLEQIAAETNSYMRGEESPDKIVPFEDVRTIHFARLFLIDGDNEAPQVFLSTNYDGPVGKSKCKQTHARSLHLDELVARAGDGLHRVFSHCRGYSGRDQLRKFMAKRLVAAKTFYAGTTGRSRDQILDEAALRRHIQDILNDDILRTPAGRRNAPEQIRQDVISRLRDSDDYPAPFPPQPDLSANEGKLLGRVKTLAVLVYAALLLGAILAASPWSWVLRGLLAFTVVLPIVGCIVFRYKELHDVPLEPKETAERHERQQKAAVNENLYHQNQLTHLVRVKPGILRALVIRAVWIYLQNAVTTVFNRGKLGGIPSIHFARWSLIGRRRVLFLSNFDTSWQAYLGDFIDKESSGLTAVWSNTEGYPRTHRLKKAGSRDAARFLAWTRYHQLPTQVWYSAYPALSVVNINDNTEIRRGVADTEAIDAATWLYWLRAVDKQAADELTATEKTREPSLALGNIQGIILRGYGHKPQARFLLYRIRSGADLDALRRWIGSLALTAAHEAPAVENRRHPFVNLAFSHRGLAGLALDRTLLDGFPLAYIQDSHAPYRRRINGDIGDNDVAHWDWGTADNGVDLVLLVYADGTPEVERECARLKQQADPWLELVVEDLEGRKLHGRKEHFGFRDGIAQPIVAGSGRGESHGNTVAPGEFLLGHRDGYGNVFHGPVSANGFNFGLDGSYLVFRQLAQNVEAFWTYCAKQTELAADPVTVASKMVGRWPSGAPLVRHPDGDPEQDRFVDDDDFQYLENSPDNDRYGARCPFGSHLRRSNPRDWEVGETRDESLRLSHLHRILRRGRPYGDPLDPTLSPANMIEAAAAGADSKPRGLQFLAFNANIERQFEFVQQQWCTNSKFAHLTSGAGPLLGPYRGAERGTETPTFTTQSIVADQLLPQCTDMERFVQVVGSTYFFMPSITAVQLIAGPVVAGATPAPALESVPDNEQVHVDRLIRRLRDKMKRDYTAGKTLRDAHPKMHGCVEAEFSIRSDLDDSLRVGLFREPKTYKAWARLSNADGSVNADSKKDIRGLAIKLLDVDGAKLIDGEELCATHDFLLISHPTFLTASVAEFDGLVGALFGGAWDKLCFSATHLSVVGNTFCALKAASNLLTMPYFSAVPYLFGDRAAKYSLRPRTSPDSEDVDKTDPDYLRKRLVKDLLDGDVAFDFAIQFQQDSSAQPVEDPTKNWTTPFHDVATLTLRQGTFDTAERRTFGENLSFNPWRCLAEHRPLGGINRARRQVYATLSKFRHERNLSDRSEP